MDEPARYVSRQRADGWRVWDTEARRDVGESFDTREEAQAEADRLAKAPNERTWMLTYRIEVDASGPEEADRLAKQFLRSADGRDLLPVTCERYEPPDVHIATKPGQRRG